VRFLTNGLISLVFSVCLVTSAAAQNPVSGDVQDIQSLIETLNADIDDLNFLGEQINKGGSLDHSVLVYRQDERSFRLLLDFDTLVSNLAELPSRNLCLPRSCKCASICYHL
jgi:hypothetical protein